MKYGVEENTEVAPGVFIERRAFLKGSTLPTLALLTNCPKHLFARRYERCIEKLNEPVGSGELTWEEFIIQTVPLAQAALKESNDVDYYLYRVASMAARLQGVPETKLFPLVKDSPAITLGPNYKGPPFAVIQWRMDPGAVFPPHNHPNYSVCTLGLEGNARIRNYEVVGAPPEFTSKKTFQIRQTHDEVLSAGRINTLSPHRDNIHRFEAGKDGARGIDITTLHGSDVGFSFIHLEDRAVDPERRIFEATWKGSEI